ncbi:MAG: S46 family peptidase [Bacteroidales bacterium]|nr:S46 family peptidase [Bacteroidales bacterium]
MKFFKIALTYVLVCLATVARADEGMWMVHALTRAIEADMQARGCKLSAKEIYNDEAPGTSLCDAIVALDFECTGSVISDKGLVITNHHCAYSDVFGLSTPEHNYLEDGYWAIRQDEEIHIPGKHMLFLHKVIDVTDEVEKLIAEYKEAGQPYGSRKLSSVMEKRYQGEYTASLESMWGGSKYYICLYEVYSDIRLVAAPPVSISAFGGDIDNWDWPQHKCDFAMYRIYTSPDGKPAEYSKDNVPLRPKKKLEISLDGYKPGDYTMVLGFPGITHRYNSSAKVAFEQDVTLPISNRIRGGNIRIMNRWMNADPAIRLKYSDRYFGLTNVQELDEGTVTCYKRFGVVDEKKEIEKGLREWIVSDFGRVSRWGSLLEDLDASYSAIEKIIESETYFKECIIRATSLNIVALRLSTRTRNAAQSMPAIYDAIDLRVEKDIFRYCLEEYMEHIDEAFMGKFQKSLKEQYGKDYDAMCAAVWDASFLTDRAKVDAFVAEQFPYEDDPLYKYLTEVRITAFHEAEAAAAEKGVSSLGREYTHALYRMREDKGIAQYPDANSTLRLTYGTVGELSPRDAVLTSWKSTTKGILQKYNPDEYEFTLKSDWKQMLEDNPFCKKYKWNGEVDFISDNDITGGNSGSPVLDAYGRLIGLAFDGNTESLAGDSSFTKDYNKCINVDIRYVLFCLENYGKMGRVVGELGF